MKNRYLVVFAVVAVACSPTSNHEESAKSDSTSVVADSVTIPVLATAIEESKPEIVLESGLTVKDGDTIKYISNQWAFISDPYAFDLSVSSIEELLGEETESKEEEFEAGEDYEAFSYYTVTCRDTKLQFYSYPGKHFSSITTPLLPLKRGIKIGMTKQKFLNAMNFSGDSLSYVTIFNLYDDYGNMEFRFRADTLNLISANWEEGD